MKFFYTCYVTVFFIALLVVPYRQTFAEALSNGQGGVASESGGGSALTRGAR